MKYFIKTFGCQMNENDSLLIGALLKNDGHSQVSSADEAEVIVINTCCVRQSAENRALGFLGSIKHLKDQKPELIIAVCGCMIQKDGVAEMLQQKYRHVGIIIGTFAAALLPAYIRKYAEDGQRIINVAEDYDVPPLEAPRRRPDSYKAQVNINFGCNNFCSYCIVPYVRGRERSRLPQNIMDEIRSLAGQGIKEVQLLGQNINSYGKDLPELGYNFARLLKEVASVDGLKRIRFMTSHPRDFSHELAETIAAEPKICGHIHLPVQSGSDRILKLMNRGYDIETYLEKLNWIRKLMPDAAVTSDLIVGFPGETEEDFGDTLDFLKKADLDAAYTFIYSQRSGTPAAEMPGQISDEEKRSRLLRLTEVQDALSLAHNNKLIGSLQEIMVEGQSKNSPQNMSGRTEGNKIVIFRKERDIAPGTLLKIKIVSAQTWNLVGKLP
ncbi:MAG: tRNA (N6-isopentenyl adenosine(37)-C2)-methylthiotransferase MiaB [Firmicutes bacterium]|nr:tRNA (N6-isopentenyl adenosine(37)-C2)-methylthiotransferase MiaB [Bacillota bacterium]